MYITTCELTLHDNLFYASRELGRLYETECYLHNYGLSYALFAALDLPDAPVLRKPYFNDSQVPMYRSDMASLAQRGIYVTPAYPLEYNFVFSTFKLGSIPYYAAPEQVIENRFVYGRFKELAVGSRFEFFILSNGKLVLPRWIRLGKWMSKAELIADEAKEFSARQPLQPVVIACPLNPLDYSPSNLVNYDIVAMPPVSLLINAVTQRPCYNVSRKDRRDAVYIPANLAYFGAGG